MELLWSLEPDGINSFYEAIAKFLFFFHCCAIKKTKTQFKINSRNDRTSFTYRGASFFEIVMLSFLSHRFSD